MSMSEKCNTLHRLLHFNFCGICDRSVVSLTPSGGPPTFLPQTPKTQEDGGEHGEGDTFDWWWCELNRKRWRESFYQARNTSGLKCSCTTPLYNAAAGLHITRQQKPSRETYAIIASTSAWGFAQAGKHDRDKTGWVEGSTKRLKIYLNLNCDYVQLFLWVNKMKIFLFGFVRLIKCL